MKETAVEEVVKEAVRDGVELMGDDFIGFKFVGEGGERRNSILLELHENNEDVSAVLNMTWLNENSIPYSEYNHEVWNRYSIRT